MNYIEEKYFFTRGKAILFGLLLIIIVAVVLFIKLGGKDHNQKYKDFEKELKFAAENYVVIKNIYIKDGAEIRISKQKLLEYNLIYNDLKDKCSGYVIINSDKNIATNKFEITYTPYIKCPKYSTTNYSEY